MTKEKIIVNITSDYMECELCGSDGADSCEIEMGEWSFGGVAVAHCYNGYSIEDADCFMALFKHISIVYEIDQEKDFDRNAAVNFLSSLGYDVDVDINLYEADDYYRDFGYEDDYDD